MPGMGDKVTKATGLEPLALAPCRTHRQLAPPESLTSYTTLRRDFVLENVISFLSLISLPFPSRKKCLNSEQSYTILYELKLALKISERNLSSPNTLVTIAYS